MCIFRVSSANCNRRFDIRSSFAYPNNAKNTLSNVILDIGIDSRIAIVGKNGAGKTTLLNVSIFFCYQRCNIPISAYYWGAKTNEKRCTSSGCSRLIRPKRKGKSERKTRRTCNWTSRNGGRSVPPSQRKNSSFFTESR